MVFTMEIKTNIPQSESITFRLESKMLQKLKSKAKEEQISLNTLVHQILTNYAEWDISAVSAGWMVMPKLEVRGMLEKLSESDLEKIAKETAEYTKDIRLFMKDMNDFEGFLTIVKSRSKKSNFAYKESRNDGSIRVTIKHDLGMKWSLRTKKLYENILYDLEKEATIEITPNTLVLNIKER